MCGIAGWYSQSAACDATALIAALRHHGPDGEGAWRDAEGRAALPKLAGMFAFAFYDCESGWALLARDAFGIKPQYYVERDGGLVFASEVKTLLPFVPETETNAAALRDTLIWGSVPEPPTLVDGIRQLPSGCFLEWDGATAKVGHWHELQFCDAPPPADPVAATRKATPKSRATSQPWTSQPSMDLIHGVLASWPAVRA